MTGLPDKHLNFRASIIKDANTISLTTVVHFNNIVCRAAGLHRHRLCDRRVGQLGPRTPGRQVVGFPQRQGVDDREKTVPVDRRRHPGVGTRPDRHSIGRLPFGANFDRIRVRRLVLELPRKRGRHRTRHSGIPHSAQSDGARGERKSGYRHRGGNEWGRR